MTKFLTSLVALGLTSLNAYLVNNTYDPQIEYTLPPATKPPPTTAIPTDDPERFPENPDGAIFRTTLEDGTLIVTGFSTNQATAPDGRHYPAEVHEHSEFPTQQPDGADDSHPEDGVSDIQAHPHLVAKRQISLIGQCRTVHYWVRPWWVYWGNIWWPVMNSPWWGWHWNYWWYCLPSRCRVGIYDAGWYRYLCLRCRTEWGWKRVPIWFYWNPRWVWIRAPVGCCCDIRRQWWC